MVSRKYELCSVSPCLSSVYVPSVTGSSAFKHRPACQSSGRRCASSAAGSDRVLAGFRSGSASFMSFLPQLSLSLLASCAPSGARDCQGMVRSWDSRKFYHFVKTSDVINVPRTAAAWRSRDQRYSLNMLWNIPTADFL